MTLLPMFENPTPFETGFLEVSDLHTIYFERLGNPDGIPVLALHGGPGTGISRNLLRCIDPDIFHIITFDQRGCGRSTPFAETNHNTTDALVGDIEQLRNHLQIDNWIVTGRSWGSTLALVYATHHPDRVNALAPISIFLARQQDTDWLYQHGASEFFPDDWQDFIAPIPEDKRNNLLQAYSDIICNGTPEQRRNAAQTLGKWELCVIWMTRGQVFNESINDTDDMVSVGTLETHYLSQGCFLPTPNWIIDNVDKIAHIPTAIIHGRYDMNCRFAQAWELHQALPNAELHIIEDAGHGQDHAGITDATIRSLRALADV